MKTLVDAQGNFMFTFEGEIDLSLPEYDGCQVVDGTEPLQTLIDENDAIGLNLLIQKQSMKQNLS